MGRTDFDFLSSAVDVWEMPPNTQGIAALMALNMLEGFDLAQYQRDSGASFHLQIEAMKLAFADLYHYIGDRDSMTVTVDQLLDKDYASQRRSLISDRAMPLSYSWFAFWRYCLFSYSRSRFDGVFDSI